MGYTIKIGETTETFDDFDAACDRAQALGRDLKTDVFVIGEDGYKAADYDSELDMVFAFASDADLPVMPFHKKWAVAVADPDDATWWVVATHRNRRSAERYARHRNRTAKTGRTYVAVQYITCAGYENGEMVHDMDQDIVLVNGVRATVAGKPVRLYLSGFGWPKEDIE